MDYKSAVNLQFCVHLFRARRSRGTKAEEPEKPTRVSSRAKKTKPMPEPESEEEGQGLVTLTVNISFFISENML